MSPASPPVMPHATHVSATVRVPYLARVRLRVGVRVRVWGLGFAAPPPQRRQQRPQQIERHGWQRLVHDHQYARQVGEELLRAVGPQRRTDARRVGEARGRRDARFVRGRLGRVRFRGRRVGAGLESRLGLDSWGPGLGSGSGSGLGSVATSPQKGIDSAVEALWQTS